MKEGIVVFGAPRSGTTLLRRILDAHPNIAAPGETNLFSACARFLHAEPIREGVPIGVLTGLSFAGFEEDEVLERLRAFALSFPREHAVKQGKARWADKTAFDAFYMAAIERLLGDRVHYVCLVRHGLDVACSIAELCEKNGVYLSELHDYVCRFPRPLEAFTHAWSDLTGGLVELSERRDDAILVRYEDLLAEPDATLGRLFEHLEEPYPAHLVDDALGKRQGAGLGDWKTYGTRRLDSSSVGRWQTLPQETVGRLGAIANPLLERLGYAPIETGPPRSDAEARRRYSVGLMLASMKSTADDSEANE